MTNSESPGQQRSTFVSVVAWIFIILTGFGTLISLLQNIMVQTMFSGPQMQAAINSPEAAREIPPFVHFIFSNIKLFIFLMFVMTLLTLITSIGLLKRKNWARKIFIVLMGLSIIMMVGSLIAQFFWFPNPAAMGSKGIPPEFKTMLNIMHVFFVITYGGIAVLLGWIIKKLLSPKIVQEFQSLGG